MKNIVSAVRLCEIHCIVQHSKSKKILKAFKDENPKACAAVTVHGRRVSVVCSPVQALQGCSMHRGLHDRRDGARPADRRGAAR